MASSSKPKGGSVSSPRGVHSRDKIKLCNDVLLDNFGPVVARVGTTILQRGRLTFRDIVRFLSMPSSHPASGLDPSQGETPALSTEPGLGASMGVPSSSSSSSASSLPANPIKNQQLIRAALLTLIQHHICWHVSSDLDGSLIRPDSPEGVQGVEYFQIDVEEVLARTRYGAYAAIVEAEWGMEAYDIVACIYKNGKLQATEVIRRLCGQSGDEGYDPNRVEKHEEVMRDLLLHFYLQPSSPIIHTSANDRRLAYEQEEMSRVRRMLKPKERIEILARARERVREDEDGIWRYTNEELLAKGGHATERKGVLRRQKRKAAAINGNGKATRKRQRRGKGDEEVEYEDKGRRKSSSRTKKGSRLALSDSEDEKPGLNGAADDVHELYIDPQVFLRVNLGRFDIHLRDQAIFKATEARFNTTTAKVLSSMIDLSARMDASCAPDVRTQESQVINLHSLREALSPSLPLKKVFERESVKDLFGSDTSQSGLLAEVLALLCCSDNFAGRGNRFVGPSATAELGGGHMVGAGGSRTPSNLVVQFDNIAKVLRSQLLRDVVQSQFGTAGARIMTLLQEKGKLEEKHISKLCLITMSETRDICGRLFAASLLALQEVPRSADRAAARTVFLWYVDMEKCLSWLSDRLYKTMSRHCQRRREEERREQDLVRKIRRTDLESLAQSQEGSATSASPMAGETGSVNPTISATGDEAIDRTLSLLGVIERRRYLKLRKKVEIITLGEYKTAMNLFILHWASQIES